MGANRRVATLTPTIAILTPRGSSHTEDGNGCHNHLALTRDKTSLLAEPGEEGAHRVPHLRSLAVGGAVLHRPGVPPGHAADAGIAQRRVLDGERAWRVEPDLVPLADEVDVVEPGARAPVVVYNPCGGRVVVEEVEGVRVVDEGRFAGWHPARLGRDQLARVAYAGVGAGVVIPVPASRRFSGGEKRRRDSGPRSRTTAAR